MRNIHLVVRLLKVYPGITIGKIMEAMRDRNYYMPSPKQGAIIAAPGCQPAVAWYCREADYLIDAGHTISFIPF